MPIKRAKTPPRSHKGYIGKETKLPISQYLNYLFDLNETAPPDGLRLKDEDIIESVKSEFGLKPISVRKIADASSNNSLSARRAKYNIAKPMLLSIRYGEGYFPCRNYGKFIDINQLRIKAWGYSILDPRLFTVDELKLMLLIQQEQPERFEQLGFKFPTKDLIKQHPFGSIAFAPGFEKRINMSIDPKTLGLLYNV